MHLYTVDTVLILQQKLTSIVVLNTANQCQGKSTPLVDWLLCRHQPTACQEKRGLGSSAFQAPLSLEYFGITVNR